MIKLTYYAQISQVDEPDGEFLVRFEDCPGCTTFGSTLEEARGMAKEALELWLEVHLDEGQAPPRPMEQSGEPIVVSEELAARVRECWTKNTVQINDENAARLTELCDLQVEVMQYFGELPSHFIVRHDPNLELLRVEPEEGDTIESLAEFITVTTSAMSLVGDEAAEKTLRQRVQALENEVAKLKRKLSMEEKAQK